MARKARNYKAEYARRKSRMPGSGGKLGRGRGRPTPTTGSRSGGGAHGAGIRSVPTTGGRLGAPSSARTIPGTVSRGSNVGNHAGPSQHKSARPSKPFGR